MAKYDIATLYRRHVDRLTRYVHLHVGSLEETEDIVQNVFLELCKPGALNRANKDVDAYIFGTARHLMAQHLKRAHARETGPSDAPPPSEPLLPPAGSDQNENDVERVHALLRQLPPKARDALRFRYLDGLSSRDAARRAGCSEHALHMRLYRAIHGLRELVLNDCRPDGPSVVTREIHEK